MVLQGSKPKRPSWIAAGRAISDAGSVADAGLAAGGVVIQCRFQTSLRSFLTALTCLVVVEALMVFRRPKIDPCEEEAPNLAQGLVLSNPNARLYLGT